MLWLNGSETIDSTRVLDSQKVIDGSGRPDALLLYKFDLVGTMAAADAKSEANATGIRVRISPGETDLTAIANADSYRVRTSLALSEVIFEGIGKLNWECFARAREVSLLDGSQQINTTRMLDSNHLIDDKDAEHSLLAYKFGLNISTVGKDAASGADVTVDPTRVRTSLAETISVFYVPAADYARLRTSLAEIASAFDVDPAKLTRYIVQLLSFTGGLEPGETLIIDAEKLQAIKSGQNVLNDVFGDFFDLPPGDIEIKYSDSADSRNIQLTVINREKFF